MAKRNSSGPSKGRRSSSTSRSDSAKKPFSKRSDDKPFKKSSGSDSPRSSASKGFFRKDKPGGYTRGTGDETPRPRGSASEGERSRPSPAGGARPFKKFSSPGSEQRGSSGASDRRRSPSSERGEKRPYKKFDGPHSDSSFGSGDRVRKRPSDRGDKRPYKKFDGPRPESGTGDRRGSSSSDHGEKRPFKKFDSPKPEGSFGGSDRRRRSAASDEGEKRPFKKFDGPRSDSPSRSDDRRSKGPSSDRGEKRPFKKFDGPDSNSRRPFDKENKAPRERSGSFNDRSDERGPAKKFDRSGISRTGGSSSKAKAPDESAAAPAGKIRLNKFIANSGVCSRREADQLITMGLISVNGKVITELGYKVNRGDEVRHESKVLRAEKPVYILMNKPKGFLTTTADPQERNTVMHIVGNLVKERIYPVGRLDRNTTGLLLLTNDGDLAEKLMHPSYNVKKIYKVDLDKPITKADQQKIVDGVMLEEGRAVVDDLVVVSDDRKTIGLEIHIGWNRVVRRIFESLEYTVVKLDRTVYAGLTKKDLARGEWRFLKPEELVILKHFK